MSIKNLIDTAGSFSRASQASAPEAPGGVTRPQVVQEKQKPELSPRELAEVVKMANKAMDVNNSNLQFRMDPDSAKPVVQIVDRETQEVLKQIPSVEMLKIAKAVEKMQGVLMSREV
jgi:flagellar protein FlaG